MRVVGECTEIEIRSLIQEHETAERLSFIETRLNQRFTFLQGRVGRYADNQKGNPNKIMRNLKRVCESLDRHEFEHIPMADIEGFG